MKTPRGDIWFLASCVELYKESKSIDGRAAFDYLRKTGAIDYIISCWEGLHMTSPDYIVDSIDEYILSRNGAAIPSSGTP